MNKQDETVALAMFVAGLILLLVFLGGCQAYLASRELNIKASHLIASPGLWALAQCIQLSAWDGQWHTCGDDDHLHLYEPFVYPHPVTPPWSRPGQETPR